MTSTQGTYRVEKDGRAALQKPFPDRTTITVTGQASGSIAALVLEAIPDATFPGKGSGVSDGAGNFVVTRLRAITSFVVPPDQPSRNAEHRKLFLSGLRLAARPRRRAWM